MELQKYIGYKYDDVKAILDENNIHYKVIETFDTKQTKLGNEIRIVNVKYNKEASFSNAHSENNCEKNKDNGEGLTEIVIYVAYF